MPQREPHEEERYAILWRTGRFSLEICKSAETLLVKHEGSYNEDANDHIVRVRVTEVVDE